jgi:hypothetical protein
VHRSVELDGTVSTSYERRNGLCGFRVERDRCEYDFHVLYACASNVFDDHAARYRHGNGYGWRRHPPDPLVPTRNRPTGGVSTVSVTVHSLARSFHAERDEMRNTQAMRKNGVKQKALAAPPQRERSATDGNPASSPVADDPHDGRVHSGSSGDDGQYQPVGRVATPASLKPGHTGDPGAAGDTSYDPMPSPAEAYANTGQANTEPQREASAEHGLGRTTRRAKDPRVG